MTAVMLRRLSAAMEDIRQVVPRTLSTSAALGWRLLVVLAALYMTGIVASYLVPLSSRSRSPCCWPRCWPLSGGGRPA